MLTLPGFAAAQVCVLDVATGQIIAQGVSAIPGEITSAHASTSAEINAAIQQMQQAIAQQLGEVGSVLKGAIQGTSAAETETTTIAAGNIMDTLMRIAAAEAAAEQRRDQGASAPYTGPNGRTHRISATPPSTCRRVMTSATRASAEGRRSRASATTATTLSTHRSTIQSPTEAADRLKQNREERPESFEPHPFPGYDSDPDEYDPESRNQYLVNVIDPEPYPEITTDSSSSEVELEYAAERDLYYAAMAPYETTMLSIAAATAYEMDDVDNPDGNYQDRWEQIYDGTPPVDVTNSDGKTSFNNILKVEVMDRAANRDWLEVELQNASTNGLLKEMLAMDSIRMLMEHENYKQIQRIAWMLAQEGIKKIRDEQGPIMESLLSDVTAEGE